MTKPLVKDPGNIRLAMLGMVEGNGHPYSWSAIINGGFDAATMAECPYPVIPQYLGAQPKGALGIAGTRVTHIWCDNPQEAAHVARASLIPHVVDDPRAVIGQVDAVIIPTDIGGEHLDRARPFIEAGLPVFIDKPLTDRKDHLQQFIAWQQAGHPILSTSCMRYSREYAACRERLAEVGELRLITMTMAKSWERYGIHALEGVYPFLPTGDWLSVRHSGTATANILHLRHRTGVDVVLAVIADLYGGFGCLNLHGTKGSIMGVQAHDTFYMFKTQLQAFVNYLRSGTPPLPFAATVEQMRIIIAGLRSLAEAGREIALTEING